MSNTWFKFKQFTVHQQACAMKVCTDACLFGAWLAGILKNQQRQQLLDIGTGTGLLSLMVAQQTDGVIDAVEIDEQAAQQAAENFAAAPWSNRLNLVQTSIQNYEPVLLYDVIFSNPPFFEHDLKSENAQRNKALHSSELTSETLILSIKKLLKPGGIFALLLPYSRVKIYEQLAAANGFNLLQNVQVQQTEKHSAFRSMLLFGTDTTPVNTTTLIIKVKGSYSKAFEALLKDYYLYL